MHTEKQKAFYQAQTADLCDDIDFYDQFIGEYEALELFAGFGRVTNRLLARGHKLETVEIDPFYAQWIDLPDSKNHISDVLKLQSDNKFQRIFAAYNSITLFTDPEDIKQFFRVVDNLLLPGGELALNVYQAAYWKDVAEYEFPINGQVVNYTVKFNLSDRYKEKTGEWLDHYTVDGETTCVTYTLRIYESEKDFDPFLADTNLSFTKAVKDFGRPVSELVEPGFIDYIFSKF